jgi:hypothetical protein
MLLYEQVPEGDADVKSEKSLKQEVEKFFPPEMIQNLESENAKLKSEYLKYDPLFFHFLKFTIGSCRFQSQIQGFIFFPIFWEERGRGEYYRSYSPKLF